MCKLAKHRNVNYKRMKKLHIITVLLLLLFQTTFSQTKEIKGDTTYWYKRNSEIQKTLELKDFVKSADEFNFRFCNHGQVIEISKDSSKIYGSITNYIYHTRKANRSNSETLSKKIILSSKQAERIYNIVQNSKILNIPSDREIENWPHGCNGITYIIEHSDKNNYWLKKYWTPSTQDSIPEAIVVLDFVKNISDTLTLQEHYNSFKNTLPKKGCYNSGGMTTMCYVSNSLELGYSGATKLPFGFYSSYSAKYLGNTEINGSATLQYNFDRNGFHHLNFQTTKWDLLFKKSNFSDFIVYNYQNRILRINDAKNIFENHQIKYGMNLKKNFGVGLGVDYISQNYNKLGGHMYAYKWFSKTNISTTLTTSFFKNQVNYKTEIFKSLNFKYKFPIKRISLGIAYEDFMDYKDLYFNVRVLL